MKAGPAHARAGERIIIRPFLLLYLLCSESRHNPIQSSLLPQSFLSSRIISSARAASLIKLPPFHVSMLRSVSMYIRAYIIRIICSLFRSLSWGSLEIIKRFRQGRCREGDGKKGSSSANGVASLARGWDERGKKSSIVELGGK